VARPERLSVRLPRIPPPLGAAACAPPYRHPPDAGKSPLEEAEVDRFSMKHEVRGKAMHVVHRLRTDFSS